MTNLHAALIIKYKLTARNAEAGCLAAQGLSNKEIASKLGISEKGVKHHLTLVYKATKRIGRRSLKNLAEKYDHNENEKGADPCHLF